MTDPKYIRLVESRLTSRVCESPVQTELARDPSSVSKLLEPLRSEPVEVFVALLLNGRHRVIGWHEVSRGTVSTSLVHPREVFGAAVRLGCSAIIVAHNHPSGDPEPSQEDVSVTRRLVEAGKILRIEVLDHVIVGADDAFVSLRERGCF